MQNISEDLLYSVFLHSPSDFSWRDPGSQPEPDLRTVAPFNLSLVCRSWRALVLGQPRLWSSIIIEDHPDCSRPVNQFCRIIEEWLRRSAKTPLQIHLRLGKHGKQAPRDLSLRLLRLFSKEMHRWEDIDFFVNSSSLGEMELAIHITDTPLLSSLRLNFYQNFPVVHFDLSSPVLGDSYASNLQVLYLGGGTSIRIFEHKNSLFHLPRLRDLTLFMENLDDMRTILAASPHLKKLHLADRRTIAESSSNVSRQDTIALPFLTNFTLQSYSSANTADVFNFLACPALRALSFRTDINTSPNPPLDLLRFFERSGCPRLVSLQLTYHTAADTSSFGEAHAIAIRSLLRLSGRSLRWLKCVDAPVSGVLDALRVHPTATETDFEGSVTTAKYSSSPRLSSIQNAQNPLRYLHTERESSVGGDCDVALEGCDGWKGWKGKVERDIALHPGIQEVCRGE